MYRKWESLFDLVEAEVEVVLLHYYGLQDFLLRVQYLTRLVSASKVESPSDLLTLISVTSTERESPHNASSEKNSEWDADGDEYSKESEQSFFGPSFMIASIDSGSFGVCDN